MNTELLTPCAAPDQRAFENHLRSARFRAGSERGSWRLISSNWPIVLVAVASVDRPCSPGEFALRCNLAGYPAVAPTASPWDIERNELLRVELRPKGEQVGMVFRADWNGGTALYAPFDRTALADHAGWAAEHPWYLWDVTRDFTWFLERIFDLLNSDDYVGT